MHVHLKVRLRLCLAIIPAVVVLLIVGCLEALGDQLLIFTSLASSAFVVYFDPEHPTNRVRTFLIAQSGAALLGLGSVSLLGAGFAAAALTMVLTVFFMLAWMPCIRRQCPRR